MGCKNSFLRPIFTKGRVLRLRRILALTVALLILLTGCLPHTEEPNTTNENAQNELELHFIDVGQGDCILLKSGEQCILIDAGPAAASPRLCEYLKSVGVTRLTAFVGTHPHEDHLGGAAAVLYTFGADNVYMTDEPSTGYFYERLLDALSEKGITPIIPQTDAVYTLGELKFEFLSPKKDFEDTNNNSLVVLFTFKNARMLFMGDAEKEVENELVSQGENVRADLLKVGHHGSRNASTERFLREVSPTCAVIQCEKGNSYGHPHKEALTRLKNCGANILRCDNSGTIVIKCDGDVFSDGYSTVYSVDEKAKAEAFYIANKKSGKYHLSSCKNLPSEQNAISYDTKAAAEAAGYLPCKNCNP